MILPAQVAPETTLEDLKSLSDMPSDPPCRQHFTQLPPKKSIEPCSSLVISSLFPGYLGFESDYC